MSPTRPILFWSCPPMALALALAACAPQAPRPNSEAPLEQRLFDLERRLERLEARPGVQPPYRDKAEIQAHIRMLEAERDKLLTRYTDEHPAVKNIDRMLQILDRQVKMPGSP